MFNEAQDALSSDFSLSESNPILFWGLNQSADQFSMPNFLSGEIVPEIHVLGKTGDKYLIKPCYNNFLLMQQVDEPLLIGFEHSSPPLNGINNSKFITHHESGPTQVLVEIFLNQSEQPVLSKERFPQFCREVRNGTGLSDFTEKHLI